jgi:iron(III) transport system permease protein
MQGADSAPLAPKAAGGTEGGKGRLQGMKLAGDGVVGWTAASLLIAIIAVLPLAALGVIALGSSGDTWPHLVSYVLPRAGRDTFLLMLGVGAATLVIGTGTAWLVTMYSFPGRKLFAWLLLLPLAVPTYIIAFSYLELFDYSGSLQSSLRQLFGWESARDYWFPQVRSLGGAIFVMSAVLYPYVYITARASFLAQSVCVLEVSRTLGRSGAATFFEVALPLARPALAAGVALALMETLNDIGAVEFLGVRTLTVAVYDTWLDRNSLSGAAQIACVMLAVVFALLFAERALRSGRRFHHTTGRYRHLPAERLGGISRALAALACSLPILFGFALPAALLMQSSFRRFTDAVTPEFWQAAMHSLAISAAAAAVAVGGALVLSYARRQTRSKLIRVLNVVPSVSYAVPGTVLAIGILIPLAMIDNGLDAMANEFFGIKLGLLLSGSVFAVVLACSIRFLAASLGAVEAGFGKISRNTDAAARTLGASAGELLRRVHLPMLRPALGAAALLVFVDSMKELPATLLLRPFNFDTLATQVFTLVSLYRYEEAALASLLIVATSLVPLFLLHGIIVTGRPGLASGSERPAPAAWPPAEKSYWNQRGRLANSNHPG